MEFRFKGHVVMPVNGDANDIEYNDEKTVKEAIEECESTLDNVGTDSTLLYSADAASGNITLEDDISNYRFIEVCGHSTSELDFYKLIRVSSLNETTKNIIVGQIYVNPNYYGSLIVGANNTRNWTCNTGGTYTSSIEIRGIK